MLLVIAPEGQHPVSGNKIARSVWVRAASAAGHTVATVLKRGAGAYVTNSPASVTALTAREMNIPVRDFAWLYTLLASKNATRVLDTVSSLSASMAALQENTRARAAERLQQAREESVRVALANTARANRATIQELPEPPQKTTPVVSAFAPRGKRKLDL